MAGCAMYALDNFPKWPGGAISHSLYRHEARAEFVFVVPPAMAYQAVAEDDEDLLTLAISQCLSYDDILGKTFEPRGRAWRHVLHNPRGDRAGDDLWATASAMAVVGMTRVLATAMKWRRTPTNELQISRLVAAIGNIIDAASVAKRSSWPPLLCNYLDDATSHGDVASTALFGGAIFRLPMLVPSACSTNRIAFAELCWYTVKVHVQDRKGDVGPTPAAIEDFHLPVDDAGNSLGHSAVAMLIAAREAYNTWLERDVAPEARTRYDEHRIVYDSTNPDNMGPERLSPSLLNLLGEE